MSKDPMKLGNECRWIELATLGRDAWNTWAKDELSKPYDERSMVDLSGQKISHRDFNGFIFPGQTRVGLAEFHGEVDFNGAHFNGPVDFTGARFAKDAYYFNAKFSSSASFDRCSFSGHARFDGAAFDRAVFFDHSIITGTANFDKAHFGKGASFRGTRFCTSVHCGDTRFNSDAYFVDAKFLSSTHFERAIFEHSARFDGAYFAVPPPVDATIFKHTPIFLDATFRFHKDRDAHARYRRLKRFASEAHDHHAELELFALEMKARRGFTLRWTRPKDWILLALGILYQVISDYGRSILRPAVALLITFVVGAGVLAHRDEEAWMFPTAWPDSAWRASMLNTFPFVGQSMIGRHVVERELCPVENGQSDVVCLANLYQLSVGQGLIAGLFMFLLIIGIRNAFRIR